MKEDSDVFKRFRDSFSEMKGHFHILEQKVPVELQMEYFKYSEGIRKEYYESLRLSDDECEELYTSLTENVELSEDGRKLMLTRLAISKNLKAFRYLEEYSHHPESDVAEWAYMALMECRISLESEFSDEKQIYISTGLGGKGDKLRFYVLIHSAGRQPFQEYQRQVIEREFAYFLPKSGCEIERLTVHEEGFVELIFLVPVRIDLRDVLEQVVGECNQYGNFLSGTFTVTNVKELTKEEILEILEKDGDN